MKNFPYNYQRYSVDSMLHLSLKKDDFLLLCSIGLPIIENDYHNFFPIENLNTIPIDNNEYIVLAPMFSRESEGKMLLNISTGVVQLYYLKLFEIGYSPTLFWTVNKSLHLFFCFQHLFINTINKIFYASIEISFEQAKNEYNKMTDLFKTYDNESLLLDDPTIESYWRKRIYELQHEIEVKYEPLLDI